MKAACFVYLSELICRNMRSYGSIFLAIVRRTESSNVRRIVGKYDEFFFDKSNGSHSHPIFDLVG